MEIEQLPFGIISRFELASGAGEPFPESFQPGGEIDLARVSDGFIYALPTESTIENDVVAVKPLQKLDALLVRNWTRLSWVVERTASGLLVQVHEFVTKYTWSDALEIGLEEDVVDDLRKRMRKPKEPVENLASWIGERVLLRTPAGKPRFFLSSYAADQDSLRAFRLHAQALTVDVKRKQDKLVVTRIVYSKKGADSIACVQGDLRLRDATAAGMLAESIRAQMDRILEGANSFLSLWGNYMSFERERLARIAQQIGIIPYDTFERKLDDAFVFRIANAHGGELKGLLQAADNEEVALAASAAEPTLIESGRIDPSTPRRRGRKKQIREVTDLFSGRCGKSDIDIRRGTIRLRGSNLNDPPQNGFLYALQTGSRIAMERREKAEMRIRTGMCPMPQLALLLENQPVPVAQRRWIEPMTPRVRGLYKFGPPTERQKKAIEVAINTPDIAVIQGPPGTGKTEVIAAIIKRIEELSNPEGSPAGTFLLTSFQHVAVANASERVLAYGLPAVKTGKPSDEGAESAETAAERWRVETAAHIEREMKKLPEGEGVLRVRTLRDLTESYRGGHHELAATARMLEEAAELATGYASGAECDGLRKLAYQLDNQHRADTSGEEKRNNAYRAVFAIRYEPGPFADDGAANARKALVRLKEFPYLLDPAQERTLRDAARGEQAPAFLLELGRLRDKLLMELAPQTVSLSTRLAPRADVRDLLSSVLESAERHLRKSSQGLALVVADYLRDLREDPARVHGALARYTAVIAETCQGSVRGSVMRLQDQWAEAGFENVIVDEAARANPLDLFIPMAQARRRIILVGDQNQLPHNLEPALERELEEAWDDSRTEQLKLSLFEKLYRELELRQLADGIPRTVMLDTQYRMPPVLGDFVSRNFYDGDLRSEKAAEEFQHGLKSYRKGGKECVAAWINVPHNRGPEESGKSRSRTVEAHRIVEEVVSIRRENPSLSIGIISFYSAQVQLIEQELEARKHELNLTGELKKQILTGTVDAFQGRQFDVVLLSMTRSNHYRQPPAAAKTEQERGERSRAMARKRYGFLTLTNRMCVALSRQRRLMIVAGDRAMLGYPEVDDFAAMRALKDFARLCEGEYGRAFS